jgi:thiol-disulfide isomerase/thioredoxin
VIRKRAGRSHFGCRLVTIGMVVFVQACDASPPKPAPAASTAAGPAVEILAVPPGAPSGPELILREMDRAAKDGRKLLVYVGASWCEPCRRFHEAAAAGQLDSTFPGLRLLEFDSDRDEQLLQQAGCASEMIPLFARPTPDGHCSAERMEGAIKGEGAVAWITPRLKRLLGAY